MDPKHFNDALQEYISFWNENPQHRERWGYTFLIGDSRLDDHDREYLLITATVMYLRNKNPNRPKGRGISGIFNVANPAR